MRGIIFRVGVSAIYRLTIVILLSKIQNLSESGSLSTGFVDQVEPVGEGTWNIYIEPRWMNEIPLYSD
jgi:hypothetical protein